MISFTPQGPEAELDPAVEVRPLTHGIAFRAGPRPEPGDINRGEIFLLLRSIAQAVESVTFFKDNFLKGDCLDEDRSREWERRFMNGYKFSIPSTIAFRFGHLVHYARTQNSNSSRNPMLKTNYQLPFRFSVPQQNPWNGRDKVELHVVPQTPMSEAQQETFESYVSAFGMLADGALGGDTVAPWDAEALSPTLISKVPSRWVFEPMALDERASHCLLSLLFAFHNEVPLDAVSLTLGNAPSAPVIEDVKLDHPYPPLWPKLPFSHRIEDSEDDERVLQIHLVSEVDNEVAEDIHIQLMAWSGGVASGAFGIAPTAPADCGFTVDNAFEFAYGEFQWMLSDCRFHDAALESLVNLCGTLHHTITPIKHVSVE